MKRMVVAVTLLFVAAAVSGCIFSSDDDKEVRKGKVSGKITMTVTGEPVANVKVMLINRNAKIDTVNYANNVKAFVDSAVTGANGEFSIDNVAPGRYAVVPVNSATDSSRVFSFTQSQISGQFEFSLDGESRTVDFIAENLNSAGLIPGNFTIDVVIKNVCDLKGVMSQRRTWSFFIPFWENPELLRTTMTDSTTCTVSLSNNYGFTSLLCTQDNYFQLTVSLGTSYGTQVFELGYNIMSTPEYSRFEYDCNTRQVIRIQ